MSFANWCAVDPGFAEGHNNLGLVLLRACEHAPKTQAEFGEAGRLKPGYAEAHYKTCTTRQQEGKGMKLRARSSPRHTRLLRN